MLACWLVKTEKLKMQIVEQDGATTTVQLNRGAVLVVVMVLVG